MKDIIKAENFVLADYFKRIKMVETIPEPTLEFVSKMMQHHIYSVPFENLDVQAGKVVSLIPEDIVDKIVYRNQGGYCYEINGIFALALQKLGISCYFAGSRTKFYPVKKPQTHMVIVAKIDGKDYLIDTGFGSHGIRQPMDLSARNQVVEQEGYAFKLVNEGGEILLKALVNDEWFNQYSLKKRPTDFIDFTPANYMNSTHPDSIFVKAPLIILFNAEGKKVLTGNTIKYYVNGLIKEKTFTNAEYLGVLKEEFNLVH
jgi:N-hydroxyarylamine O-acetyltransferase